MPLARAGSLVDRTCDRRIGIGAFNVIHLETAEALVSGAASAGLPVILQISENCVSFHGGDLEPLALGCLALARRAAMPVAVHLDHATRRDLVTAAIQLGLSSVMYDGSSLPYEENLDATCEVVTEAHVADVAVEAELGEVGGKTGAHDPRSRTAPDEAVQFVEQTGVDSLAVAVGSSHAMTSRTAQLDTDLIARLAATVPVPLVLHGSSGVDDQGLAAAISAGMSKINVSTHLNAVFTGTIRSYLDEHPDVVDSRKYVAPARWTVAAEAARLLTLFAEPAAGRR